MHNDLVDDQCVYVWLRNTNMVIFERKKEIGLGGIRTHDPCGTKSPSKRKFRQSSDYANRASPKMDAEKS